MAKYKKLIAAGLGFVVAGLAQYGPLLPEKYQPIAAGVVALATLFGVYQAENAPLDEGPGA